MQHPTLNKEFEMLQFLKNKLVLDEKCSVNTMGLMVHKIVRQQHRKTKKIE